MLNRICLARKDLFLFGVVTLISAAFLPGVVGAQEGLQGKTLGLVFTTRDLRFQIEDLAGATKDIEVKETETEIKIELSGDILFDFDKWDIRPAAEPVLTQVAEVIKKYPDAVVLIEGFTDSKGSDSYNLRLSDRRAASVKEWLVKNGAVGNKEVTTKGRGEADPVAPNTNDDGSDNPDGRQKNRRVEITVQKG